MENTLRGRVAVIGIGETPYYRHGQSPDPEFKLVLKAILAACKDANIDPRSLDGFASYSNDRSDPSRLAAALGCTELRFANMQWGGGGGGACAATANAAAAIAGGLAKRVVVFRGLAQGQFGRFGQGLGYGQASDKQTVAGDTAFALPYGLISPAHRHAVKVARFMHETGIGQEALRTVALACYYHAQNNPRAVMYGRPLDEKKYDDSRWIVEPFHLFDSCQENDGAAAVVLCAADQVGTPDKKVAYLLGAAMGSQYRAGAASYNIPDIANAGFKPIVKYLFEMARLSPKDIDAVQSYENFTGAVVMSLVEHGFVSPDDAKDFFRLENLIAPSGKMPLNTSGGNLAEAYMHGLGLQIEAVRQIRGDSTNQVPGLNTCLVSAGPLVTPVSSIILGSQETL